MNDRWLILADDLSGAADSGVAFARRGLATVVTWGEGGDDGAAVRAHDMDSRRLNATDAATRQRETLRRLFTPGRALFKKMDSTLRGQPAAEIAAACAVLGEQGIPTWGVLAPANPAMGRTTRDGRVYVHDIPLEQTETWRRDHSYASADLAAMLAEAGVRAIKLPIESLRRGEIVVALDAAAAAARGGDAVMLVCDAEGDDDLALLAAAVEERPGMLLAGTAGLANALAARVSPRQTQPVAAQVSRAGALVVVGSLSSVSHAAALELAAEPQVRSFEAVPQILLDGAYAAGRARLAAEAMDALDAGQDVLVRIAVDATPDLTRGPAIVQALARCLAPVAEHASGVIATGGETAAALLTGWYVPGIRLVEEVEPGVSLGVMLGTKPLPVITKPGAFGDAGSLIRSLGKLRLIRNTGYIA